jgi:hypothetical protein
MLRSVVKSTIYCSSIQLDNITRDNEKGTFMLTDVAISGYRNVTIKVAEEILKCKYLITEIRRMGNVKTKVIPVIIGTTETISKSLRQYLSNTPAQLEIKELQTTAIQGAAHKVLKVLM